MVMFAVVPMGCRRTAEMMRAILAYRPLALACLKVEQRHWLKACDGLPRLSLRLLLADLDGREVCRLPERYAARLSHPQFAIRAALARLASRKPIGGQAARKLQPMYLAND
jgi:hypothetical protein